MERNIWHHNIRKYVILIKAGLVALLIVAGLWCAEYQNRWQSRMDNAQELMQDLRKQDAEALFPKLWQTPDAFRCEAVTVRSKTEAHSGKTVVHGKAAAHSRKTVVCGKEEVHSKTAVCRKAGALMMDMEREEATAAADVMRELILWRSMPMPEN